MKKICVAQNRSRSSIDIAYSPQSSTHKIKLPMTYNDYHNLSAYQKAKDLTRQIITLSDKLPKSRAFDAIYTQIVRSASSIGANLAEGYGRSNPREYRQFLNIARGSNFETEYWLETIQESTKISTIDLIELNKEIIRLLTTMIKNLGNDLRAAR